MFQVVAIWNLTRPDDQLVDNIESIESRGYNNETFLTGEFANNITNNIINPLSVGDIADLKCPTKRGLYFRKGKNRSRMPGNLETWGTKVGPIVERYIENILGNCAECNPKKYSRLIQIGDEIAYEFIAENQDRLNNLQELETHPYDPGDTDWLKKLLNNTGRAELSVKLLHSFIKEKESLNIEHIKIKQKINPNTNQIGISSNSEPDFIIPEYGIVGDIKTGVTFEPYYQLTCAGYAMAYENEHGPDNEINWGVIYFIPTRVPHTPVRTLTFPQVYIFPISEDLRTTFLDVRDEAYDIISKEKPPKIPIGNTSVCETCRYREICPDED